jgi:hypothetical protein
MPTPAEAADFDEAWYLRRYPDIAEAIAKGELGSGFEHYTRHGQAEGRLPCAPFNAEWYASAYPIATVEAGSSDPTVLQSHYESCGKYRGYLPDRLAPRPANACAPRSKFGGLWIDQPNALDMVRGKYEVGLIDQADKECLERFIQDGYVILPRQIPPVVLDRADEALEKAYSGGYPELKFQCYAASKVDAVWDPATRTNPAKALDAHWFSEEIRDAIFADPIARFLSAVFERPALASQTLGFFRGSGQPLHQDSAYVAYSLPLQFLASWIALEDVVPGAGELEYLVGSHRVLPEFVYGGEAKSIPDARRYGIDSDKLAAEDRVHEKSIQEQGANLGLNREKFRAKRGDVLIWHADLAHGGSPISKQKSRKSIVTHYCPREIAPLYFEFGKKKIIKKHSQVGYYTTGVYA